MARREVKFESQERRMANILRGGHAAERNAGGGGLDMRLRQRACRAARRETRLQGIYPDAVFGQFQREALG